MSENRDSAMSATENEQWFEMKQVAKLLNRKNFGRTRLFRFLREEGLLMAGNEPYQNFVDAGIFKVILKDIFNRDGRLMFRQPVTLVSHEGIAFIRDLLESAEVSATTGDE